MEQAYEDRKEEFGAFLKRKRNAIHVSQSVLAQGLCSFGELARIERGERITGKALKDRLLYRLGISPGCYENFLFGADYERWQEQQELLYAVSREKVERAGELLEKYREKYESQSEESPEKRLEQQFILSLEVQLMRIKGPAEGQEPEEWEKELAERFRMALEKTVSVSEGLRGKKYSVQEWNLILEYLHYGRPAGWEERYQEILEEAGDPRFDPVSQAKIYAKAAYYLCRDGWERSRKDLNMRSKMIELCESAIERLRKAGRLYYLWELLQLQEKLLTDGAEVLIPDEKTEETEARIQTGREWRGVLEAVYKEFGIPKETRDFCWLYVEGGAYHIGRVIRSRRELLGFTRKKLCEGICSEKSLYRLECEGQKMQAECVRALMKRLNLSAEYYRTELITSDPKAIQMMDLLRDAIRNHENEQAEQLLEQLGELISLEIPSNRQVWLRCQALIALHKGSITREQFIDRIRAALACTLDYKKAMKPVNKYLTDEEISCIQNIVSWKPTMDEEKKMQIDILEKQYRAYEEKGQIGCFISMYEIIMSCVASERGNMGEYDKSDQINKRFITESLYLRRLYGVHGELYSMVWNYEQRQKKGIPVLKERDPEKDLNHCIIFSRLCQATVYENFYKEKLAVRKKSRDN